MKGLIPAAGKGTRLEPITLAIPKELLMVGDKAVIEHVIDSFKAVGITEIVIVVGWKKHAILDYLGSGDRLGVKITYVVQDRQNGLSKAVSAGEHVISNESFVMVLGDDFFYPKTFLKHLIEYHKKEKACVTIGVTKVQDTTRHGILDIKEGRIVDLIEKPSNETAPSKIGCIGIYAFEPNIFDAIEKSKPGINNEYQIVDAIKILLQSGEKIVYKEIEGEHIDVGTITDLKKANLRFSQIE